jgi:hypothetical protein
MLACTQTHTHTHTGTHTHTHLLLNLPNPPPSIPSPHVAHVAYGAQAPTTLRPRATLVHSDPPRRCLLGRMHRVLEGTLWGTLRGTLCGTPLGVLVVLYWVLYRAFHWCSMGTVIAGYPHYGVVLKLRTITIACFPPGHGMHKSGVSATKVPSMSAYLNTPSRPSADASIRPSVRISICIHAACLYASRARVSTHRSRSAVRMTPR